VARVAKRAEVSSADFYKHFKTKDDCFLAAYDAVVERIRKRVLAACADQDEWPAAVRAALAALLGFLASEPAQARLVLVEGLFAGPPLYDRYQRALDSFAPYLREGAGGMRSGSGGIASMSLPEPMAEALIGGIVALITKRIIAGEGETLPELLPELTRFTLAPSELR
jgi:AcrR family transcriptional regulator